VQGGCYHRFCRWFYNGESKWTAATDISSLVQEIPGGLSRYRPCLLYLLLAERDYSDDELQEPHNVVVALFRLETAATRNNFWKLL